MSQADGTVIIDTKINSDGIEAGTKDIEAAAKKIATSVKGLGAQAELSLKKQVDAISKINREYALQFKKVDELKKKVAEYGNQKVPTEEYAEIQSQIDQATQKMMRLIDAQNKYIDTGGKEDSSVYKRRQYDIEELANTIKYAEGDLKDLEETGKAFTLGTETKEAQSDMEKLAKEEQKLEDMGNRLKNSFSALENRVDSYRDKSEAASRKTEEMTRSLEEARAKQVQAFMEADRLKAIGDNAQISSKKINEMRQELDALNARQADLKKAGLGFGTKEYDKNAQRITRLNNALKSYEIRLTQGRKAQKKFNKSLKEMNSSSKSGNMSLGKMLGTSVLFSFAFQAISAVMNGVMEGFQNLAQYSEGTNSSISMLMSSLTQLKNSFATAFAPILTVVAPILSSFINMISKAVTYVGMLFAALTGQKTFTQAVAVQEDYAAGLKDTGDNAKKATKELKRYLSPLDDISTFESQSDDVSSGVSVGEPGKALPSQMFEDVQISAKFLALAEKIKNFFQPILDAVSRLQGPVTNFFSVVGETALWLWDEILAPLGTWIIQDVVPKVIDILGQLLEFITIILDFINKNVLPILTPIIEAAVQIIEGAVNGILDMLGGLLDFIIGFFTGNWDRAFSGLAQIFSGFSGITNSILDAIQGLFSEFDSWLQGVFVKDWTNSLGILGTALNGLFDWIEDIWNGVKQTFNGIITFIKGVFSLNLSQALEGVKQIFSGILNTLVGVVKTPFNAIIGAINGLISGVVSGINTVIRALNRLNFKIPSWVPAFGGKSFGFNISTISAPRIPYLASGAVIPPNREFLAVLGDQSQGNNLEAPEGLLRRIVREESGTSGNVWTVNAQVGRKTLFKLILDEAKMQRTQTGKNPFELT